MSERRRSPGRPTPPALRAAGRREGRGFTLVELLVVIAIISLLLTMLMPMLSRAKDIAQEAICLSNHRSLVVVLRVYLSANDNLFPYSTHDNSGNCPADRHLDRKGHYRWVDLIDDEAGEEMRICPGSANHGYLPYTDPQWVSVVSDNAREQWLAPNPRMMPRCDHWQPSGNSPAPAHISLGKWAKPARLMVQVDHKDDRQAGGWVPSERIRFRHDRGMSVNLGFLDGHAENWDRETVEPGESPRNLLHNNSAAGFWYPWGEARE